MKTDSHKTGYIESVSNVLSKLHQLPWLMNEKIVYSVYKKIWQICS